MKNLFALLTLLLTFALSAMQVVIPDRANDIEKFAASELASYLKKVTGKDHKIVTEKSVKNDAPGYYIGNTSRAKASNIILPEKENSFVIKRNGNALIISGRDGNGRENDDCNPAGTLFGVYHFLHKFAGVRWLYPGEDGEMVPSKPDFSIPEKCESTYIPRLDERMFGGRVPAPEIRRFFRRNMFLFQSHHPGRGGHTRFIYPEYGKSNPEFFALTGSSKRNNVQSGSLCLSNPELQNALIKHAVKNKHQFVSAHDADSVARCGCPNCEALNGDDFRGPTGRYAPYRNMGERYARFYKALLEQSRKLDAGLKISAYAYQSYFYAPRQTRLDKNIHVGIVPDLPFPRRRSHTEFLRNEYRLWAASGASLYLRPNYFNGGYCMPEVWYDEFADEFKFLCDLGITGMVIDSYMKQMWATRGLDQYISSRLIAHPEADVEELFNEYVSSFKAAAPEIRKYFKFFQKYLKENCDKINTIHENSVRRWYFHGFIYAADAHKIFPEHVLQSQLKTLDDAAKLVSGDAATASKVAFLRSGLEHAIAVSRCAKIIDSQVSNAVKKQSLAKLSELRNTLPRFAIENGYCERIENNCWKISAPAQLAGTLLPLPEFFKVKTDPENVGEKAGFFKPSFNDSKWQDISSWRSLESSNIFNYQYAFYRTKVHVPESDGRRCLLRLGAVDKDCTVWVNGKYAGNSVYDNKIDPDMWALPRYFDITDFVDYGRDNQLCIKIGNRGGGHGGLWKPSFIILEKASTAQPLVPIFKTPSYAKKSKSGKYDVVTVSGVRDPKRNRFLALIADLKLDKTPTQKYRIRGEVRIRNIGRGRVDVSFRQQGKAAGNKFTDRIFQHNTESWEEFSFETEIIKDAGTVKLYLICRNLPENSAVSFRKIQIEKL